MYIHTYIIDTLSLAVRSTYRLVRFWQFFKELRKLPLQPLPCISLRTRWEAGREGGRWECAFQHYKTTHT